MAVVFADSGETTFEALPSQLNRAEFTIKLRSLAWWDHLSQDDLAYSNISHVSSKRLEDVRARLGRKRYIKDDVADVRAVPPYCRPPDFRHFRYTERSWTICDIVRRTPVSRGVRTSRPSSRRGLACRN